MLQNLVHILNPIGLEAVASTDKPRARVAAHVHDADGAVLWGKPDGEIDYLRAFWIQANFLKDPHHLIHATLVMVGAVGVKLENKIIELSKPK